MEPNLRQIIDISLDFITLIDPSYRYVLANEAYCRQFGKARTEIEGKTVTQLWGEDRFRSFIQGPLDRCLAGQEHTDIDRFQFGDGFRYVQVTYTPYREGGIVTHAIVYSRDLTTMKDLESRLQNLEYKDPVTGLFNRKSFDIVLEMELEKARRSESDKRRALLYLSVSGLAPAILQRGSASGDLLLESLGGRIKEALRATDFVFHWEGADFAVLLTTAAQNSHIETIAEKVHAAVTSPFPHPQGAVQFGCQIGFSVFPDNGTDQESLVRYALSAATGAPFDGSPIVAFEPELHRQRLRLERLKADLRPGLVIGQFEPCYQPILSPDGQMIGAEALLRWTHPTLGPVEPDEVFALADQGGEGRLVDRWVLFRLAEALAAWVEPMGDRFVSVNLSARGFASATLLEDLAQAGQDHQFPPRAWRLEYSDFPGSRSVESPILPFDALADRGIEVILDGVGGEGSRLATLKDFRGPTVKLDRYLVAGAVEDAAGRAFLEAVLLLVKGLGKTTVAEGVETKEQFQLLRSLGVEAFQGSLFCPPLPRDRFERLWTKPGSWGASKQ